MSEFMKQNIEATEQYMDFLAKSQEQILEQARQLSVPTPPEFQAPAGTQPSAELPTPRELTMAAFAFTEKLIAQQRSFMEQYLDIAEQKSRAAKPSEGRKKN